MLGREEAGRHAIERELATQDVSAIIKRERSRWSDQFKRLTADAGDNGVIPMLASNCHGDSWRRWLDSCIQASTVSWRLRKAAGVLGGRMTRARVR